MYNQDQIIVLKFGSSVLRDERDLPRAVHEIYRWWRDGFQVVAVVSAFGDTTDQLLRRAEGVSPEPERSSLATLLATGEAASSALLGLALGRTGIPARVLDPVQAGLRTVGANLEADLVSADSARLRAELRRGIVVLPGFVGRSESGDTTLLGRGGSDLSALFLAQRLDAECVLVKDVDGLYTSDPALTTVHASRFAAVSYETAARLGGQVVQQKAVRFAQEHRLRFVLTSFGADARTEVGPFADRLEIAQTPSEPLRVALLGCGTVGGGVYERLSSLPELFTLTGVGTRTSDRARAVGVPEQLLTSDLEMLVNQPCDVVIELIGGTRRAAALIESALRRGRSVVSGNKALLAAHGQELELLAADHGARLCYSAAVGGVLPALETLKRAKAVGPLQSFSGVLNGTCNFILDRLTAGETMTAAVSAAQRAGLAEAHPKFDLSGIDAAEKLVLLARAAFAAELPLELITRKGIEDMNAEKLQRAREQGQIIRLVAECRLTSYGPKGNVAPIALPFDHPLADVTGADNRLLIEPQMGPTWIVSGRGAGRWPTAEAVMADLFDIRRKAQAAEAESEDREECVA
jgi:homoserine dehydrogenase